MRMYQSGPGDSTGRGNLLTIKIPSYEHLGDSDSFYWEAVEGRMLTVYRRLRERQGMTRKEAREVVWTMVFAVYMAMTAGDPAVRFESQDQQAMRRELEEEHRYALAEQQQREDEQARQPDVCATWR